MTLFYLRATFMYIPWQLFSPTDDPSTLHTCRRMASFPQRLYDMKLTFEEKKGRYGLSSSMPHSLRKESHQFAKWSSAALQLDRGMRYRRPTQSTTIDKQRDCIAAYAGFLHNFMGIELKALGLRFYSHAHKFMAYISFLVARNAGQGHICKHISLARKVNAYLATLNPSPSSEDERHTKRLDDWLGVLEAQIFLAIPKAPRAALPSFDEVCHWAEVLSEEAFHRVKSEEAEFGRLTSWKGARMVQDAIIARLLIGTDLPPARSFCIKTSTHPDFLPDLSRCPDPGCRTPGCKGNRFILTENEAALGDEEPCDYFDYLCGEDEDPLPSYTVSFIYPHHKTARGDDTRTIRCTIPPNSILADLLALHILRGHEIMAPNEPALFVSGNPKRSSVPLRFSDARFGHYFKTLVDEGMRRGLLSSYIRATDARSIFVEEYMGRKGMEPGEWKRIWEYSA